MVRREFPPAHANVPNLAPMIDVVMVILIFFMLGTTFAVSEGMMKARLPVPPANASKVAMIPTVRIHLQRGTVANTCRVLVMGTSFDDSPSGDSLAHLLAQKRSAGADLTSPVQITADPDVPYQFVVTAMDACNRTGFTNIQLNVSSAAATIPTRPS
ncbi:MAG TPA: biopolymer transporter ExbD [Phycisphaerae bacterium]|nr:biopolymer transporter ExbD [Phycisphaerae bacterium]